MISKYVSRWSEQQKNREKKQFQNKRENNQNYITPMQNNFLLSIQVHMVLMRQFT